MLTETARANMQEKYEWAAKQNEIIQRQANSHGPFHTQAMLTRDLTAVKQAFWTFLQAYQQIRFYHGAWLRNTNRQNQGNRLLDAWKAKFLNAKQAEAWDALNALRTEDTHNQPVIPEVTLRPVPIAVIRADNTSSAELEESDIVDIPMQYFEVKILGKNHIISSLVAKNMIMLEWFIDTFDQPL